MTANAVSDLPEPDSPTMQSVSALSIAKLTSRTGADRDCPEANSILSLSTVRTRDTRVLISVAPMRADRASHRLGD